MSNLSYNYVESGIVLNISSYADLKKINVTPQHFAVFGEAFQFILDELDESRQVPSRAILTAKYPELDQSTADAADVSFFSGQLKHQLMYRTAVQSATEWVPKIKGDNPQQAVEKLIQELESVTATVDDDIEVYDSGSIDRLSEYSQRVAQRKDRSLGMLGIPTPFKTLNRLGVGWMPGELYSLFARPTVGKSFMSVKVAAVAMKQGYKTLLISTEMPVKAMSMRMDSFLGKLLGYEFSLTKLRRGEEGIDEEQYREFLTAMDSRNILFPHHLGFDALSVSTIRNLVRKYSPDLVVVDGVYLLSDDSSRAKWEQNDNLFKGLKNIAMAHEIPVFCTTQAGREAVDLFKPPKLNQVANGDALVRASDIAFAMSKVEDEDNQRYLYYMKQRDDVEIKDKSVLHWDVDIGDVQELMQEDVQHDAKF